ncbi:MULTISPECIES: DUF6883 domain-containing protein [unclassified Pseudomonas]|uniref:RHS repeat-associated core domain-containing protein n=1 Tax=unclassified Pseudomonas TaxID=196821 RepID=UPI0024497A44|nr:MULTISPECIES: DUF6883 domain-containing protein [unclassified Pseudomonas]MDH0895725.1 RHS domain-containing protein [Pseudomonas sp. GD03875]MDH1066627.1 RHS domain-containing protein [Pseudomonas sp. GD03985]
MWEEHRYAYDAWGNCIEKKSGSHTERQFQWDAEHQLSRVTVTRRQGRFTHTEHWGYDYDPFGRRITKYRLDPHNEKRSRPWLDDETTHYGWDGNRLLLERQGDRQQLYIYTPHSFVPLAMVRSKAVLSETQGLPPEYQALKERYPEQWEATVEKLPRKVASTIRQLEQPASSDKSPVEVLYYHTDHLGTPRELTDASGHIVWSATYKAWGNTAKTERPGRLVSNTQGNVQVQGWEEQDGLIKQNLRFQGQYYDQETGLHYNRFRHYDPDYGRFVSQDPIGLKGGFNSYQYAPNPMVWVDPLGLCRCPGDGLEVVEGAHSLVGANRAVIDPRKLTDYALNPDHPVGGNKARVFESALGFTKENSDLLLKQLQEGVMKNTPIPGKVDQYGARFTVDIPVTGPNGSGVVRSGWIYKPGSNTPELTTIFVK